MPPGIASYRSSETAETSMLELLKKCRHFLSAVALDNQRRRDLAGFTESLWQLERDLPSIQ